MQQLAVALAYALPALGAAIGIGVIGNGALNALGRNPEKLSEIRTLMITAIVFADSLAIIGIVAGILALVFPGLFK
jgi:F-type H+-transporting ATPase subunit c